MIDPGDPPRPRSTYAKPYLCNFCDEPINFKNRAAFNNDGSLHKCKAKKKSLNGDNQQATLFAMAAMNAIINAQIQVGGVDHIHSMNFYDVADASWQIAVAMVQKEEDFRGSF